MLLIVSHCGDMTMGRFKTLLLMGPDPSVTPKQPHTPNERGRFRHHIKINWMRPAWDATVSNDDGDSAHGRPGEVPQRAPRFAAIRTRRT